MRQHLEQKDAGNPGVIFEKHTFCGELYQRYAPRLLAYLCRHLPSLHDAEDTLLDVFLAVLERETYLRTLTEEKQSAWIWTVARNRMADYHRQQRRKPHVSLSYIEEIEDERYTPEETILRLEEDEQLHQWIHKLPPLQQEVLSLRFAGELRCSEIATVLHKSSGAIRALLTRAFRTLRTMYDH